jgi:hypothetical protein
MPAPLKISPVIYIFVFISAPCFSQPQPDLIEKVHLKELLDQRKERFSDYFNSIEKKSGIFGNKTKKDLTRSNDVLRDIVRTDNEIISVLNRALDYKSFEKTGFNYEKLEQDRRVTDLKNATDTLTKQLEFSSKEIVKIKKQSGFWKTIATLEVLLFIGIFYRSYRRRKKIASV